MTTKPNDSAAPIVIGDGADVDLSHYGLTKREYFAALAMQGLLSAESENFNHGHNAAPKVARLAVAQADALIEALNSD